MKLFELILPSDRVRRMGPGNSPGTVIRASGYAAFGLFCVFTGTLWGGVYSADAGSIKYVNASNATPAAPFSTWAAAATTIQDALDVAATGDTVLVTNGLYASGSRAVEGTTNRVVVNKAVEIRSVNGPEVTLITGQGAIRCVYVTNGVVLSGFTLTNGATEGDGGGVYNCGSLNLSNCVVTGNSAAQCEGGGVYNSGNVVLNRCVIADNSTEYMGGGPGGGLFNAGNMLLANCTISGNDSYGAAGGGIENEGAMILGGCVVSNNFSGYESGGGIDNHNLGHVLLTNCTIVGNGGYRDTADGFSGGGIGNDGVAVLRDCSIAGNYGNWGGGVGNGDSGFLSMTNCTIEANGVGSDAGWGGGVGNFGTAILVNTTVSGNNILGYGAGAGIDNSGTLTLISSTICRNQALHYYASSLGGGVYNSGTVNAGNCILAGNTNSQGPDFYGSLSSVGFNLIQDTNGCTIVGDTTGNLLGVDPRLGPLQNNGGPTWTHALLPGSPAIDQGTSNGLTTDQRGMPRLFDVSTIPNAGDGSDIGAYEWVPRPPTPTGLHAVGQF